MAVGDLSYAFNPAAGETPQTVARKRMLAEAILGNTSHAPKDVGEGLNSLGQAIMYRRLMSGVTGAETAGNTGAAKVFGSLFGDQFPSAPALSAGPAASSLSGSTAANDHPVPPINVGDNTAATPAANGNADTIKQGLVSRGMNPQVADAFVMNFNDESGLNPGVNEKNPIVPGSRGGFGLAQWTGPRRKALEDFAAQQGKPVSDTDMQLDFLMHELGGPEASAYQAIQAAPDTGTAAAAVVDKFLRPAPEYRAVREKQYLAQRGAPIGDSAAAPVQVASNDASIGMPPAMSPDLVNGIKKQLPPTDPRQAIAAAMSGQGSSFPPEFGPHDVPVGPTGPSITPPELNAQSYAPQQPATDAKQAILQALAGQGEAPIVPPMSARNRADLNDYKQSEARYNADALAGQNGPAPELGPQDVGATTGAPGAVTPAGQRVLAAMMQQQPMGGGTPMPMVPPSGAMPIAQPDMQTASTGPVAPPISAPANPGAPQGPGAPGEIRKGADGKNYQYAQTTGMAGATGDQGWIETNMAAPQDVAQAQPGQAAPSLPPPTTVQDRPVASASAPDLNQLPAMAGGNADVVQPGQGGPSVQQLMQAAGDPWVMQKYGPVVEALIQQKMKQGDPGYALDLAKKKMDLQLEQQQLGGAFRGDSIDAQAWNILQTRDPSSKEYQTAYSIVSQPKMQMVQTAQGMVQVQVPPVLPGWLKAPGAEGGPAAAPEGSAPNAAQAAPGLTAPAGSAAAAGAPPPGGTATASAPIPGTKQPATETQARNGAIGKILLGEVPTLGANFKALADPQGQLLNAIPGGIGNAWQSEEYQRAANAVKTSVSNVLYSLSGASSNPGEVLNQIGILTPAFGDKPGTIADKLNRFKTYVRSISSEANDPELTKMVETAISQMDAPAKPEGNASPGVAAPKTDAEFNALPSGAIYTDPDDGKQYRKP